MHGVSRWTAWEAISRPPPSPQTVMHRRHLPERRESRAIGEASQLTPPPSRRSLPPPPPPPPPWAKNSPSSRVTRPPRHGRVRSRPPPTPLFCVVMLWRCQTNTWAAGEHVRASARGGKRFLSKAVVLLMCRALLCSSPVAVPVHLKLDWGRKLFYEPGLLVFTRRECDLFDNAPRFTEPSVSRRALDSCCRACLVKLTVAGYHWVSSRLLLIHRKEEWKETVAGDGLQVSDNISYLSFGRTKQILSAYQSGEEVFRYLKTSTSGSQPRRQAVPKGHKSFKLIRFGAFFTFKDLMT